MASERPFLGIVTALPAEARALGLRAAVAGAPLPLAARARAIRAGIGRARAEDAARALIEAGAGALLAWGTAAALDAALRPGDLVLPRGVVTRDGRHLEVDAAWHRRMWSVAESSGNARAGNLAEADRVLASGDDKLRLRALSGALVADMESAAVVEAANRAGVPVLVVRAVADAADMVVPGCALAALDGHGEVDLLGLALGLARTPRELPALVRLAGGFRAACARLAALAERAGPEFLLEGSGVESPQA